MRRIAAFRLSKTFVDSLLLKDEELDELKSQLKTPKGKELPHQGLGHSEGTAYHLAGARKVPFLK